MAPDVSTPSDSPLTMTQKDWEIRADGVGLNGFDQGQLARWFLNEAVALRARLNDEITRRGSTIGCAFCFQQYPAADKWDDEAMVAATRKHVAECPKHPAAEWRTRAEAAESRLAEVEREAAWLRDRSQNPAEIERDALLWERAATESRLADALALARTAIWMLNEWDESMSSYQQGRSDGTTAKDLAARLAALEGEPGDHQGAST